MKILITSFYFCATPENSITMSDSEDNKDVAELERSGITQASPVRSNQLDIVEEGELEGIAKPAVSSKGQMGSRAPSTRGQAGSRPFGTAASQRNNFRQTWSSIAPSLEILSPEEIMEHVGIINKNKYV